MAKKQQVHKRIVLFFMKEVLDAYDKDRISLKEGMGMLSLSRSHFFRYLKMYKDNPSGFGISYGRTSSNRKCSAKQDKQIATILREEQKLIKDEDCRVHKYNFPALSEELRREYGVQISSEAIRSKAIKWNLHKSKPKGVKIYRELVTTKIGRLFQHDTCLHQWSPYLNQFYLILTVDDHSRMIVHAKFYAKESSMNHILSLRDTAMEYGLPLAYYTDRHSIFTFNKNQGPHKRTYQTEVEDAAVQWKRVLKLLRIQGILAKSPQAKGKVESKFKYLQGRIVRRCAKEEVTTLQHAQRILDEEVTYYNEYKEHAITGQTPLQRFSSAIQDGRSVLRPFTLKEGESWKDIFCLEYEKKLNQYGKTTVKSVEIQMRKAPSKKLIIHYIEENDEIEIRVWHKNVLLKVIKA